MASTLKAERNAVRARLNDLNFGNAILQADLVDAAIQDVYLMMVGEGLGERIWEVDYITLSPATPTYSMPNSEEQAEFLSLRIGQSSLNSNAGTTLICLDPVAMNDLQRDVTATGIPIYYSLLDGGGNLVLTIYPAPDGSVTSLDALHDQVARNLVLDTDAVSLSRSGLAALRDIAAGRVAKKLGPKMLEKLDLPPDAWQDLKANGERMLYAEKCRIARQWQPTAAKRPGYPVTA